MKKLAIAMIVTVLVPACRNNSQKDRQEIDLPGTRVAREFNDLFMGELGGFTGGDGTYSVLLPNGSIAWIFGDTFIDGVNEDNTRQKQDPKFVRNTLVIQDGDSLRTLYSKIDGRNASFAIPAYPGKTINENERWFWPGDGFIEDGLLKIFFSEFTQQDTGMWDFQWEGTWIGAYSLENFEEIELHKLADGSRSQVHFGHAVHVSEKYTYVYGAGEGKPHVAKYPSGDVKQAWEYFTGDSWSSEIEDARPMGNIPGSEQFSIFPLGDLYILLTQMGSLSAEICSFTSSTPYGPWENKQLLYTTPLPDSSHRLLTYNALAHPQFVEKGNLLVSYNTNSQVLGDHYRDASIYRPRFVWVPLALIDTTLNSSKKGK